MTTLTLTRRALFCKAPMVLVPIALAGCAGIASVVAVAPQIASDAALIADALTAVLPTIRTLTGLAGGALNTVESVIAMIKGTAAQLAGATTTTATSLVQALGGGVGTIAGLLGGLPLLPGVVSTVISAALGLLPAIEQAVGIVPTPAPAARRFAAMQMTPDQARAELALIARR